MTAGIDRRGKYWNSSDEGAHINRGQVGKLPQEMLEERAKLHALRFAYGRPTIQNICDHWMDKYQIRLHYNSEKEWAWRNESRIVDTMNRMVEAGEIQLSLTDTGLANTLSISGESTGKLIRSLEGHLAKIVRDIDLDFDPMAKAGYTIEEYLALDETAKKVADHKISVEKTKQALRVTMIDKVSSMLRDHKKVLIDTVRLSHNMFDDSKAKSVKLDREINQKIANANAKQRQIEGFDPMEVEVTDEMRHSKSG